MLFGHEGGLATGEGGHLAVGGGNVTDGEDGGLPRHLERGANLDEPVGAARGEKCVSEVVAVGHDAVAAEPDVGDDVGPGFGADGEGPQLSGLRRRCLTPRETFRAQVRLLATRADALDPLDSPHRRAQED